MRIDPALTARDLQPAVARTLDLAAAKVRAIDRTWDPAQGTPVFTVAGRYATRGWTEWTQGFQYGCAILAGDGLDDAKLIARGRAQTVERMAAHVTHVGVHDHGFNNLSTYGNLRRLAREGRIDASEWEMRYYELALRASACAQAGRWTERREKDGSAGGYIHSFNGPHSLFVDTIRTVRILGVAHQLGHVYQGEGDAVISLLGRAVTHGLTTGRWNITYGEGVDTYDVRGRTAHEAIFNTSDGAFRCRSSQQGFAPGTTWTRGLAWAVLGYAEQLAFLDTLPATDFQAAGLPAKKDVIASYRRTAEAVCDCWIDRATALDGIPYWDTGAPHLHRLGDWQARAADPTNPHEPVDSSAAAIAAQGLLRLGAWLDTQKGGGKLATRYTQAGLTVARALFAEPYLSTSPKHQGLILHSIYHRPNGWDHVPAGSAIPRGESSLWGDYHALELAVHLQRLADRRRPALQFFDV
jgi:unsaturated chondroitin disaccharide hydrolase